VEVADEADLFTAVYDSCRQRVWAYVVSKGGREVAEEVVSETFTVAWRRFGDLPEEPLPWLLAVARNILRDTLRTQARREAFTAEAVRWTRPETSGDIGDQVAERSAAIKALASLSEQDKEVLMLVAWQGLAAREAARVVGCSAATLRVRLHRARKRFEQALEQLETAYVVSGGMAR
jgi:RNA polymerase sigma-70 factor (ECF subfamily)